MAAHKDSPRIIPKIRMTKEQKQMFKDLGGAEWLRKYLARQLLQEEIQLRQKN